MAADTPAENMVAPPGFRYVARAAFVNHVGPIFQAESNAPGRMRLGLLVAETHCNSMGYMHGGMAATLVDSAMARALVGLVNRRAVTLRMTIDYLDPLARNDWLEVDARVASHGAETAQTEADILVGDAVRGRASAVFRLLRALKPG